MNQADFDFVGDTLRVQNNIAADMGYFNNHQASYNAAFRADRPEAIHFTTGISYSNNESVDIVRLGTDGIDNLDMSARTDSSRDLIFGLNADDDIHGGGGNDFLYGGAGLDEILGGDGDDLIYGGDDSDVVRGGAGADTLFGGNREEDPGSAGGSFNDQLYGEDGDDILWAGAGEDTLYGDAGDDWLHGGVGDNVLDGGEGDDHILGGAGNDTLTGGNGNDHLHGDDGIDAILDSAGDDILAGGGGDDFFSLFAGNDLADGGEGSNTFYFDSQTSGLKTVLNTGSTGVNTLIAAADNAHVMLSWDVTSSGLNSIDSGGKQDVTVSFSGSSWTNKVDLTEVVIDEDVIIAGTTDADTFKLGGQGIFIDTIENISDDYDYMIMDTSENLVIYGDPNQWSFAGDGQVFTGSGIFDSGSGDDVIHVSPRLHVYGGDGDDKYYFYGDWSSSYAGGISDYSAANKIYVGSPGNATLITDIYADYFDQYDDYDVIYGQTNSGHSVSISRYLWDEYPSYIMQIDFGGGESAFFNISCGSWTDLGFNVWDSNYLGLPPDFEYGPAYYWPPEEEGALMPSGSEDVVVMTPSMSGGMEDEFWDMSPGCFGDKFDGPSLSMEKHALGDWSHDLSMASPSDPTTDYWFM